MAEQTPDKIFKVEVDPIEGTNDKDADYLSSLLDLNESQVSQFRTIYNGLVKLFLEKDLSLLEVNPLVITSSGALICLDA